ncbi:MAG: hypothetical protein H6865_00940 [Rhodospirillales bacterium]|nr:hypothetical protein [Alphaproteobacteria bacterium]MCB9986192.1 hypothetical protein [Rhodospirillales bacterium]USO07251.1 MAG: hypothetical protein H6866_07430 [Rhodospirillales bacterium]
MTRRPRIALYQDYVHSTAGMHDALAAHGCNVVPIDAAQIITNGIDADALAMPGGADLYYCEKLNGAGNATIRAFVEAGGGYLGICAGAYYACRSLEWNSGEITGPRELALIDAHAYGPLTQYMEGIDRSWCGAAPITTAYGETFRSGYIAGPVFQDIRGEADVLAHYAEGPAVIARGRVILSSPHIEYTGTRFLATRYSHKNPSAAHERHVGEILRIHDAAQREFFDFVLKRLINGA